MADSPITILRKKRARVTRQLDRFERLVAGYQDKLARIEAEIARIEPELPIPRRHRRPNPIFTRGELPRLALGILRQSGEPLSVAVIAVRALRIKGIVLPDPAVRRRTRHQLRWIFAKLDRRGVTVRVGERANCKRAIASQTGTS